MEKNGMNKEVMILIELQTLLFKLEFNFVFFVFFAQTFIQKIQKNVEAINL